MAVSVAAIPPVRTLCAPENRKPPEQVEIAESRSGGECSTAWFCRPERVYAEMLKHERHVAAHARNTLQRLVGTLRTA